MIISNQFFVGQPYEDSHSLNNQNEKEPKEISNFRGHTDLFKAIKEMNPEDIFNSCSNNTESGCQKGRCNMNKHINELQFNNSNDSHFFSMREGSRDSTMSAFSTSSSSTKIPCIRKSSKFLNSVTNSQIKQKNQVDVHDLNNSFSYYCPYEPSVQNSLNSFGFAQLNPYYCPHRPSNNQIRKENAKKYAKRMKDNLDLPKNTIHLDNVLKLKDKRTTVMIRHIPNKYSLEVLMQEINVNFEGKYDVLYLPIDFVNNSNLGFAFINFVDPMHLIYFYDEFIDQKWQLFNSGKRCQLVYGKLQGKTELLEYIKKRNGIHINSSNEDMCRFPWQKTFYLNNNINHNPPKIELPMKYYKVFINYYLYALCKKKNDKVFIVEKYYNF